VSVPEPHYFPGIHQTWYNRLGLPYIIQGCWKRSTTGFVDHIHRNTPFLAQKGAPALEVKSVPPPGEKGTNRLIGLVGYFSWD